MNLRKPKTAKVLGFFLILIFFNFSIASEPKQIQFLDLWDFSPLSSVTVVYKNEIQISDSLGKIELYCESSDDYYLEINLPGYYSKNIRIDCTKRLEKIYLQPLQQAERIQIVAEKSDEMNLDLAGPSSVIRTSPIETSNAESISSLLNHSVGIFVKNYGANSSLKTVSIRGLGAEQTAINYDGININNQQLGSIELNALNLQNVTQIELYRGGNSSLFGSGAIAGGINFVPSLPTDQIQYSFYNSYGSWNNITNSIMTNFSIGRFNHRLNLVREGGDNDFDFSLNKKIYSRQNNDYNYYQIGYTAYYNNSDLLLEFIYSNHKRGVPKQVLDQVKEDDFAWQKDHSILSRIKWIPFSQTEVQFYWMHNENKYNDQSVIINDQILNSKHTNNVVGMQISKGMLLFETIRSYSKIELEKSNINSTDAGKHSRIRTALSSILECSIYRFYNLDLKLSGAFRWEYFSETGNIVLPKIGLSMSNNSVKVYSSFGFNFRIPTFNELYWQPGGNPNLKSEESNDFECGISYLSKFIGLFTITLDYYRNQIENMIKWIPDNQSSLWSPLNIGAVKAEGIELGFNSEIIPDIIVINGNYSYSNTMKTKAEFDGDKTINNQVPFVPREMTNLNLNIQWENWRTDLTWNRTGFRYLTWLNSSDEFLPSHNLFGLSLEYEFEFFNQECKTNITLNNLLDENYQVMYGYPMPKRNFKISLMISN